MNGYSYEEIFDRRDRQAWRFATEVVANICEPSNGRYRCHEVARAVFRSLRAVEMLPDTAAVLDGSYCGVDHSWILIDSESGSVLDVYSVAQIPMVRLVDLGSPTLQRDNYKSGPDRDDIRYWLVDTLVCEMLRQLPPTHRDLIDRGGLAPYPVLTAEQAAKQGEQNDATVDEAIEHMRAALREDEDAV